MDLHSFESALCQDAVAARSAARRRAVLAGEWSPASLATAAGGAGGAAGTLARPAGSPRRQRIPRIVHQTYRSSWVPWRVRGVMRSWRVMNPDWEIRFYDNADCLAFVTRHFPRYLDAYLALPKDVERSDFFRYLVVLQARSRPLAAPSLPRIAPSLCPLAAPSLSSFLRHLAGSLTLPSPPLPAPQYGGVYADLDTECRVPLSDVIAPDDALLAGWELVTADSDAKALGWKYVRRRQVLQVRERPRGGEGAVFCRKVLTLLFSHFFSLAVAVCCRAGPPGAGGGGCAHRTHCIRKGSSCWVQARALARIDLRPAPFSYATGNACAPFLPLSLRSTPTVTRWSARAPARGLTWCWRHGPGTRWGRPRGARALARAC